MCEEDTLRHEIRKIQSAIFFSLRELYAISSKNMREYREIAPENDPWDNLQHHGKSS